MLQVADQATGSLSRTCGTGRPPVHLVDQRNYSDVISSVTVAVRRVKAL
jgi:hypothetical protein